MKRELDTLVIGNGNIETDLSIHRIVSSLLDTDCHTIEILCYRRRSVSKSSKTFNSYVSTIYCNSTVFSTSCNKNVNHFICNGKCSAIYFDTFEFVRFTASSNETINSLVTFCEFCLSTLGKKFKLFKSTNFRHNYVLLKIKIYSPKISSSILPTSSSVAIFSSGIPIPISSISSGFTGYTLPSSPTTRILPAFASPRFLLSLVSK